MGMNVQIENKANETGPIVDSSAGEKAINMVDPDRPLAPETWAATDTITTTAAAMLTTPNVEQYATAGFTLANTGAETVICSISIDDGVSFIDIIPIDLATGIAAVGGVNLPDGSYWIKDMPFTHIKWTKSAAVVNATLNYMLKI